MFSFGAKLGISRCLFFCLLNGLCFNSAIYGNTRSLDDLLIASTAQSFESSWLEDYLPDDYHEEVLQYLQALDWEICPPVPDEVMDDSCLMTPCTNETECQKNYHCCSNGCVFTCLVKLEPPAVVDWLREPKRKGGETSWLIEGMDTIHPIQECSTSKLSGSRGLMLCPQGFTCKIQDQGNPLKHIPNAGICVAHKVKTQIIDQPVYEGEAGETVIHMGCQVNGKQHQDDKWFTYEKHRCKCSKGSLLCNVRKKKKHHKSKVAIP